MIIAYKGFKPDLTCTFGAHTFQYQLGIWNEEPEANCARNGFHCAENPLDCLSYYSKWNEAVYYIVLADGDINEDAQDSRISCTRMKLVKKLTLGEFVAHSLQYVYNHPMRESNAHVAENHGVALQGFAIARGKEPTAQGKIGDYLGLAKEEENSRKILELGLYYVDGKEFLPDTWYDVAGVSTKGEIVSI